MILVDAAGLHAERPGRVLFSDLSLTVSSADRLAIVGVNGSGKSTLLGALAGARPVDRGEVRAGRGSRRSHLDQDAPLPAGTVAGVTGDRWEAAAVRDRLGLAGLEDRPTDQLSGGQIKRVALARALLGCGPPDGGPADDADLLILDEPTNHLDVDAIEWLEEWLAAFRGGLVLVTHDRHVLDRVCNRILEIDRSGTHLHDGGYASYLEAKAERLDREERTETKRKNLARAELAWLRRGAPARTSKPKARIESAAALLTGGPDDTSLRDRSLGLHLGTPRLGDRVIECDGVGAEVGGTRLFEGLDLRLDPRERLGIVGPNGAGKTTLLRILAGTRPPDEGVVTVGSTVRTGLFSQDAAEIDPDARVRDLVTRGKKEVSWQDNALMERFWFDTDSQWAPAGTLSGGERRRLQLLLVLLEQPNVLLLDEPTNDLDLDTLRLLEDFLDDWPGALVVVSHDRALLQRTVVDVLVIDGGVAARRPGGLGSYLEQRRAGRVRGKAEARAAEAPRSTRTAPSTLRRDFNAAERALAKVTAFRDAAVRDLEATPGTDHAAAGRDRSAGGRRPAGCRGCGGALARARPTRRGVQPGVALNQADRRNSTRGDDDDRARGVRHDLLSD